MQPTYGKVQGKKKVTCEELRTQTGQHASLTLSAVPAALLKALQSFVVTSERADQ